MVVRRMLTLLLFGLLLSAAGSLRGRAAKPAWAPAIVYYDMTGVVPANPKDPSQLRRYYDETFLVTSLQGLVNRHEPRLFVRYNDKMDDFWWARLTERGSWMADRRVVKPKNLRELLALFPEAYKGAVVWDERVPATSNLASTIAGVEDLLVLRADADGRSLHHYLTTGNPPLKVIRRLLAADGAPLFTGKGKIPGTELPSTGSAKNDAYRWLIEKYIKTGKTDTHYLGYYLDGFWLKCWFTGDLPNHTVNNQDYVIARRGVLFDLDVWEDETAVDDPGAAPGTDFQTLNLLLKACYQQFSGQGMIQIAGFIPWAYKYTDNKAGTWNAGGRHPSVATEWKYAEILSAYNAYMDADALALSSFPNGSFYQHYPLPKVVAQNPKPTRESLIKRGILAKDGLIVPRNYYANYQGDYDAASWLYQKTPEYWSDPARGSVPMSWAFNPNLAQRFAFGMAWLRQHRTPNDFFIAGDSGAGYINPHQLSEPRPYSGLPSGVAAWEAHCRQFYRQWDISLSGFVIDGNTPFMRPDCLDAYTRFSPDGLVLQSNYPEPSGLFKNTPFLRIKGDLPRDTGNNAKAGAAVIHAQLVPGTPNFILYRSILQPPAYFAAMDHELKALGGPESMLVDLYTLMFLVREYARQRDTYWQKSPYAHATTVTARPGAAQGLTPLVIADGTFKTATRQNQPCWLLPAATANPTYLYMNVDDNFNYKTGGPMEVEFSYLDEGQGSVMLQYDSTDAAALMGGVFKDALPVQTRANSQTWKKVLFVLADANFKSRQQGVADFRIVSQGDPLALGEVTVRRHAH